MVVDGAIAGVGAVITFLPQILILFFFILLLEGTGYMVRAAFLMDKLMHGAGLSGRAFIPLLSSFACAVPGIMATRTIDDPKDRLTTILVAPLMTCSARLPVYTLIIAAFIPNRSLGYGVGLQGLVMFGLYITGIGGALLAALVLRRGVLKGGGGGFMMELPKYQWPSLKDVAIGLLTRVQIFLKRAGTIILGTTIVLWAFASIPQAQPGQKQSEVSIAGHIANGIEAVVKPIGFNHDIALALLPAMAAREVAVSAIATVYSLDAGDDPARNPHWSRSSSTAGRYRPRSPFSPGSSSRRSASRRSPSPGARPTAGSGRFSWSLICSHWPISRRERPTGLRSPRYLEET